MIICLLTNVRYSWRQIAVVGAGLWLHAYLLLYVEQIDGLIKEIRNSSALAMGLRVSYTNLSKCSIPTKLVQPFYVTDRKIAVVAKFPMGLGRSIIYLVMSVCDEPKHRFCTGLPILCMFYTQGTILTAFIDMDKVLKRTQVICWIYGVLGEDRIAVGVMAWILYVPLFTYPQPNHWLTPVSKRGPWRSYHIRIFPIWEWFPDINVLLFKLWDLYLFRFILNTSTIKSYSNTTTYTSGHGHECISCEMSFLEFWVNFAISSISPCIWL